ncbi:MAG: SufE family protein [Aliidiomarina sp.]|uniref:SufE family protein n=1 Tax=Aliidiomarina sp. TaxID=1872439 RepID=UPI0025C57514|nr:SufE family protein [Aliidiomarina sp.]MCH8501371.1 SufE family protein [Aliidiomarina sp.]
MAWPTADDIQTSFQQSQGWESRYRLLLHWAKGLTADELAPRHDDLLVEGCEAAVWLDYSENPRTKLNFRIDSTSRLIRGLIVVMLAPVQNTTAAHIAQFDFPAWLEQCGLSQQLSPSRSNGLFQISKTVQTIAQKHSSTS